MNCTWECYFVCSKVKGADVQEKVVYGIVEEAGNKGTHNRDNKSSHLCQYTL